MLLVLLTAWCQSSRAADPPDMQWVWFNEGNPASNAPSEPRYFRKTFDVARPTPEEASLEITADNLFTVWLNGVEVGKGSEWQQLYRFNVKPRLVEGKNVLAVEANNQGGPAGLTARLRHGPNGKTQVAVVTDNTWKSSKTAKDGWQKPDFDDATWKPVRVIGPYGKAGPWSGGGGGGGKGVAPTADRFTIPDGFKVELAVRPPEDDATFSLVNMTFDARGRLLVSREGGPVLLCHAPDKDGVAQKVTPYCQQVKNCQGMCWVEDALYLVGNGPKGTGLYRVRDTNGDDQTDEATLVHAFQGGMGEHGPHAVLHGPDNMLYLVIGNHAWAKVDKLAPNSPLRRWPTGGQGPDQGKPDTTEDVLLPRLNDANGHAANIRAPGGTIWRMKPDGSDISLVSAGFRNQFDAAFSPSGELFTFDSDMEWDEGLPWYRAVRAVHCPPGSDFVWRTGAANTPDYYLDSLPPLLETGRGSPVGVEFYDHHAFPERYRGAFFMADWAIGTIYAVHLTRDGASYKAKAEKFITGSPMNVTDTVVGPDGALYFTLGGRGTKGGVFRVRHPESPRKPNTLPFEALQQTQPLAAWQRSRLAEMKKMSGDEWDERMPKIAADPMQEVYFRNRALSVMQEFGPKPKAALLVSLLTANEPEIRAHAAWLLGVNRYDEGRAALIDLLSDSDAMVRRRVCEALVQAEFEPPVEKLWPLLADKDRFVRTAARLVLQRIEPNQWVDRLWKEENDGVFFEGVVALCKIGRCAEYGPQVFQGLGGRTLQGKLLDYLRVCQLALIHGGKPTDDVRKLGPRFEKLFPHSDPHVNRELAILLVHFQREGLLEKPIQTALLAAMNTADDRQQQIHYAYCLRLLTEGWTPENATAMAAWYDSTRDWKGGNSFAGFLANIFRDALAGFGPAERKAILASAEKMPLPALALARRLQEDRQPELLDELGNLQTRLNTASDKLPRLADLKQAVGDARTRTVLARPTAENWPHLVRGLDSTNPAVVFEVIEALKKSAVKPKADDPVPYRAALLAVRRLDVKSRWKGVELLRHWSNDRRFGADEGDAPEELAAWSRWFGQTFPKEPSLPDQSVQQAAESKYKFEELLTYLEKDPVGSKGNAIRGRQVFEKATCIKCHRYGKDGESIGPDLTTLSKRFKRADTLESLFEPSKIISDQYRAHLLITKKGQSFTGLMAVTGDTVTVLLSDGVKVTLKKDEIAEQYASLVSNMPEKLLDPLTKEEIADLFAYLESEPLN